jgi:hypothetical protein
MDEFEVVDEPTYTFGSTDNARLYPFELDISAPYRPTSIHGLLHKGEPVAVFGSSGGASGVHANSLLCTGQSCFLAVGSHVVCFSRSSFHFWWSMPIDQATCFGIHYSQEHNALISHGELDISRFSENGEVIWSSSGQDIFTGHFSLTPSHIEVTDFGGRVYSLNYKNGQIIG